MTSWTGVPSTRPCPRSASMGRLDCGSGLLLLIRQHIDPLEPGAFLEIKSTDATVEEDLPAWCRLTRNELVSRTRAGLVRSYLVRKGGHSEPTVARPPSSPPRRGDAVDLATAPAPTVLPPFAVMGIGSWPRPGWLLRLT